MLVYVIKNETSGSHDITKAVGIMRQLVHPEDAKVSAPRSSRYNPGRCPQCKMKAEHKINGPMKDCLPF